MQYLFELLVYKYLNLSGQQLADRNKEFGPQLVDLNKYKSSATCGRFRKYSSNKKAT